jgi:hypothetical protein
MPIAEDFPMPGPEETAVFILKPRSAADELFEVATGAVRIPASGRVELSLIDVSPHGVPEGTGQLAVSCQRGDVSRPRYDWTCRVSAPGGGIQLRNRLDFDLAPKSGYREAIVLGYRMEDSNWRDRVDEDVFVRLDDGNYGYLSIRIRTLGDYYVALRGVLNQHGSRLVD